MKILPILVNTILSPVAREQYLKGDIGKKELEKYVLPIQALSRGYLEGRPREVDSQILAEAYALYFGPINFAKVELLIGKLPADFIKRPLRVLDYGCGPATSSLALLCQGDAVTEHKITLVDSSSYMHELGKRLISQVSPSLELKINKLEGEYDLIFLANVLNELSESDARELLLKLTKNLSPNGAMVIVEPALLDTTRKVMGYRDFILEKDSTIMPLFPCTHRDNCPMLNEKDNWCHGTLRWEEPRLTKQLDELTGFNKHRIKYSGFVFMRNGEIPTGMRLLSPPVKSKQGVALLLCGPKSYGMSISKDKSSKRFNQYDLLPISKDIRF